MRTSVQSF